MSDLIKPGSGILFMKVGTHAMEPLETIIARKTKEIEDTGYALWGYGGNTCHPITMVQPFARSYVERGATIYLCMHEMDSKHFAEQVRADQSSEDGINWVDIPRTVNVVGSRYALAIKGLRQEEFDLSLAQTSVAIGPCQGRAGDQYIIGRVDKACLAIGPKGAGNDTTAAVKIKLVAELMPPYAVFLRNRS